MAGAPLEILKGIVANRYRLGYLLAPPGFYELPTALGTTTNSYAGIIMPLELVGQGGDPPANFVRNRSKIFSFNRPPAPRHFQIFLRPFSTTANSYAGIMPAGRLKPAKNSSNNSGKQK